MKSHIIRPQLDDAQTHEYLLGFGQYLSTILRDALYIRVSISETKVAVT